jgi:filamentous hemagglutinin family protein
MKTTPVSPATTMLLQRPSRSNQRRRNRAPRALSWAMASAFSGAVATLSASLPWTAAFAQNVNPATVQSNAKLPQGGQATVGGATYNYSGNQLTVTTTNGAGNRSAINWQSFNIGAGNTTHIAQPNAQSSSLNRVVTNQPSAIYGTLSSNGNVILVNQNGIAVGRGGVVDTAGFTASTLNTSDADYAAGKLKFQGNALSGSVQVDGTIRSANGDVMLFAPNVTVGRADALVRADNGNVIIGAGQEVEVTGRGLEGVKFVIQSPDNKAINLGTLQGNAVGVFAGSLRHSGVINAQTASLEGGRVVLRAIKNIDIVKDAASTEGPKVLAEGGVAAGVGKAGGNITIQSTEGDVRGCSSVGQRRQRRAAGP